MNKYITEFIGTFFLVLTIGFCVSAPGANEMAALAIGSVLMVMIYAGGPISGGHYNPAVTLAVWMRGKCDTKDVPFYMAAQAIAGVIAAVMVVTVKPAAQMPVVTLQVVPALLAEFLFTFALAFVVLNVATAAKSQGNFYFGLAIGFTVMAGAYSVGNISGGAFNPAVALGITVMGISSVSQIWIFLLANFAGGACAALAFKAVNPDEV